MQIQPTIFQADANTGNVYNQKMSRGHALPLPPRTGVPSILRLGPSSNRAALQLQLPRRSAGVRVGGIEHHLRPGASHRPESTPTVPARTGCHAHIDRPTAQDPGPPAPARARARRRTKHQRPQPTDAYHLMAGWLSLSLSAPMPMPEERSTGARFNGFGSGARARKGRSKRRGRGQGVDGGRFPAV